MDHHVAVVILNYNGKAFLEKFLPFVIQYTAGAQIVVADNNSTDDSVLLMQTQFPQVSLLQMQRNEGFSKGYNLALKQIKAKYYVLLNSDVEVTPGWLTPLIELMESDTSIAACQPKIKAYANKQLFEYAGAAGGYIDKWGYPLCRGRLFESIETDTGQYNDTREIFWATGACMVVRADLYWLLGGLDDYFFAHMEEIDLCWRMKNAGYKIMYCGKSEVFHVGGGTLHKSSPRKTFLNFRNGLVLLYKNLPQERLWITIFIRLVLDSVAGVYLMLTNSPAHLVAVIQAHFSFYKNFTLWRQQRKKSMRIARDFEHIEVYKRSLLWTYFVQKKKKFAELQF